MEKTSLIERMNDGGYRITYGDQKVLAKDGDALAVQVGMLLQRLDSHAALIEACEAALTWYDRDGSVGGIVEPMDQLRAALAAVKGEQQ